MSHSSGMDYTTSVTHGSRTLEQGQSNVTAFEPCLGWEHGGLRQQTDLRVSLHGHTHIDIMHTVTYVACVCFLLSKSLRGWPASTMIYDEKGASLERVSLV